MRTTVGESGRAARRAEGDLGGGYHVDLLGPHRWRLTRNGREVAVYPTATEARAAARRHFTQRREGRRALAHAAVAFAGAVLLTVVQPFADIDNPAAERARGFVAAMDAAYGAIRSGTAHPTDYTLDADGFDGAVVSVGRSTIENLGAATVTRVVLVGPFEGACYVVRWPPDGPATTGVLQPDLACEPGDLLAWTEAYVRSSVASTGATPIWEDVVPADTTRARWYLLAVIAGVLLMVDGVIGVTVALIRRSRGG